MSSALAARSLRSVWQPCTQMKLHEGQPPIAIARAQGPWLQADDGWRFLDGVSSWWVNLFGHGHPPIKAALADQLDTLRRNESLGRALEDALLPLAKHPRVRHARRLARRLAGHAGRGGRKIGCFVTGTDTGIGKTLAAAAAGSATASTQ